MGMSRAQEEKLKNHYLTCIPEVERENVHEAYEKGQRKAENLRDSVPEKLKALWNDLLVMIVQYHFASRFVSGGHENE